MRECEEDDSKGMVSDTEGVLSLGGKEMLRSIRDGICVCVVVVMVVVVALIVAIGVMRVVVLMVGVGIVVLVRVARVACIGVVGVV